MEYLVDGGGSQAIHDAVRPVLDEIQALLGAELGVVVYEPHGPGPAVALASTGPHGFLPNEAVVADPVLPRRAPASLDRLDLRSRLRGHGVRLRSSVVVPWRDRHGHGAVIVGNEATALGDPDAVLDDDLRRHYRRAVGRAVRRGRRDGALAVGRELRAATRTMADAAAASGDGPAALTAILGSARELFRAEVAYLGVPVDGSGTYVFDEALGIRTAPFRRLRVGHGQGLGGLARRLGRPVCSANYAADGRLEEAPVDETRHEGIVSAMAAPVSVGSEIAAVLYIGDRLMRPFTSVDEELLEELAGHAAPGVRRRSADADRARALERAVRERVAYDLHDSVVRGLVAIGFEAEQARHVDGDDAATRLDTIARAAEACMSRLRGELELLVAAPRVGSVAASEILDRIALVPERDVLRVLELDGADLELDPDAADALVRVGQEAVTNAEQHSGCDHLTVRVETSPHAVALHVTDDGTFGPVDAGGAHFGLRGMHAAVDRVGGRLEIEAAHPAGTHVHAVVAPGPLR
ncbi:GAF domain-containing sensor histidine kinase [Actinomycetospora flava]|uniref:GAF domain-containing protein n=1 Tax=Actinomycetospora flava TaxID=3129232 RepID=A0ABU8M409_9PSEU